MKSQSVPRIIHQIWYNFDEWGSPQVVPAKYAAMRQSWKRLNPDWMIRLWTESESEKLLASTPFLEKFRAFKLAIHRADFFRWVVLFYFGGCYADMDCTCMTPINVFLSTKAKPAKDLISQEDILIVSNNSWATNACIIASPRHTYIEQLLYLMPVHAHWSCFGGAKSALGVFTTTGPVFVKQTLQMLVENRMSNFVKPKLKTLPQSNVVFDDDIIWHLPRAEEIPAGRRFLAIHHGCGSWQFQNFLLYDIIRVCLVVVAIVLALLFFIQIIKTVLPHSISHSPVHLTIPIDQR
jgi:mannosyltransferase OCH1-like enzyme